MHGFSERVSSLEVGHLLGLRWFELGDIDPEKVAVRQRRIDVWTQAKDLADLAATECRGFTPAETAWWEVPNHELDALDRKLAQANSRCTGRTCGCGASIAARTTVPVLRGAQDTWQPGENVAVCRAGGTHMVPTERCGCGFWAYWSLGQIYVPQPAVVGLIKGYGDTIEGDNGFRTSHAKIIAVYLPHWDTAAALALEERYQVDVYCSLGAMLVRNKAPEGQRPLRDDYYTHAVRGVIPGAAPGVRSGDGKRVDESYLDYARRIGLADPLAPCVRCGQVSCGTGQAFCNNCQVLEAQSASKAQTLNGDEAQAKLHNRRESWASGTTVSVTPGTTFKPVYSSGGFQINQTSQADWDEMIRKLGLP